MTKEPNLGRAEFFALALVLSEAHHSLCLLDVNNPQNRNLRNLCNLRIFYLFSEAERDLAVIFRIC